MRPIGGLKQNGNIKNSVCELFLTIPRRLLGAHGGAAPTKIANIFIGKIIIKKLKLTNEIF